MGERVPRQGDFVIISSNVTPLHLLVGHLTDLHPGESRRRRMRARWPDQYQRACSR
jgi:hypothetical protein